MEEPLTSPIPAPNSGREIDDAVRAVAPAPTPRWSVPAGLLRIEEWLGDAFGAMLHQPLPLKSGVVDRLLGSAWYSPARINRELHWRAHIGLGAGLLEMVEHEAAI